MKNSKRLVSLLLALVMVFAFVACKPNQDKPNNDTGNETKTESKDESGENKPVSAKELTVAGTNALTSMDYLVSSKTADHTWTANFVETLLEYDRVGKLVGSLAESWKVSDDKKVWTFKLKPGIKWVTAQGIEYGDVTADDFVSGLRHAAEFKSQVSSIVSGVIKGFAEYMASDFSDKSWEKVGVKAVDPQTVEYTLETVVPYFADLATYSVLMPVNREFLESKGAGCKLGAPNPKECTFGQTTPDSILYNGAFILQSYDEKSSIVMVKNEQFYDAANVMIEKYTEIYDDGSDPYSIKKGYENGTYPSFALRPTWSDYNKVLDKYKDNAILSLPNAITFGLNFNFNRQVFNHTNYANDQKLRDNTKTAILNENFRKALRASFDKVAQLAVSAPLELAKGTVRNINNFPEAGSTSDGKSYHQVVNDIYNADTSTTVDLSDGQDAFFSKEEALKYIEAAKAEGVAFPVHLDIPVIETSDTLVKRANSLKESVAKNTDNQIVIEPVLMDQDSVYAITYHNEDPAASDYDISTFTGWGPDYNDPKTFVETFTNTGTYMKSIGLGGLESGKVLNKELKDKLGFTEYNKLYEEADKIVDNNDSRIKAFAKADALLLEKCLFIPASMQTRFQVVTKMKPFQKAHSQVGLSEHKIKYLQLLEKPLTTKEYEDAKAQWEKEVEAVRKGQ